MDLTKIPIFCSHEHWGSIDSIGMFPGGFIADNTMGATPKRQTTLADILLDPYQMGNLFGAGSNPDQVAQAHGYGSIRSLAQESPEKLGQILKSMIQPQELTGTYQCIRKGIQQLYGHDLSDWRDDTWSVVDQQIRNNYSRIFEWYQIAMRKVNFSGLIRPVHPEYYFIKESAETAALEASFTRTILRIDPFLEMGKTDHPRKLFLAEKVGIMPNDAESWREFINAILTVSVENGNTGIKQLQAYFRNLDFPEVRDDEVPWGREFTPQENVLFQNWLVNEFCRQAHDRHWPHQIHVGTHNLSQSSPLPLVQLATRYPQMNLVLLHCWPFLKEAGWLAKHHPNIFIDTCWEQVLSPSILRQALDLWLTYVPDHKITMGQDSTSIEMAAGSAFFSRKMLGDALSQWRLIYNLDERVLLRKAHHYFHNNAVSLYRLGKEVI